MKHDLSYYLHDGSGVFRIQLAGHLSQGGARALERAWSTASSVTDGKGLIVDLSQVTSIDASGCELLDKCRTKRARLAVNSSQAQQPTQPMTGVDLTLLY